MTKKPATASAVPASAESAHNAKSLLIGKDKLKHLTFVHKEVDELLKGNTFQQRLKSSVPDLFKSKITKDLHAESLFALLANNNIDAECNAPLLTRP
jgi:hypothetical protein